MADRRNTGAAGRGTSGAGKWIGVIIGVVIVAALVAWIYAWYGGDEEALVETEQPESLEGEEAVVAPDLESEEVLTGEQDVEQALEPEVYDEVELGEEEGALEEEEGLLESEGALEEDEGLLEGETATGEQGVLEGAGDLGVSDDAGLGEEEGLPGEDPAIEPEEQPELQPQ